MEATRGITSSYDDDGQVMTTSCGPSPIYLDCSATAFSQEDVNAILYVFGNNSPKCVPSEKERPLGIQKSLRTHSPQFILSEVTSQSGKIEASKCTSCSVVDLYDSSKDGRVLHPQKYATRIDSWNDQLQDLLRFKAKHGHCSVPNYCSENYSLGHWVKRQRYQYNLMKAGKPSSMTAERVTILEGIGFVWNAHDALWEEKLNDLRIYREIHGHSKVPHTYPENPELAVWAKRQRREFKVLCRDLARGSEQRSKRCMTVKRVLKLAEIDFVFDNQDSKGALDVLTECLKKHQKFKQLKEVNL